ncbi:MAG: D-aminoacyl-tRNA deacylase [Candidatus Aminicenantaceae bacterium]
MKIVLQRVKEASVEVKGKAVGKIGRGLCLLIGIEKQDSEQDVQYLAKKTVELRIFPDREGKMNLSLQETKGEVLAVSQFTLAASTRKGRRPSFDKAEEPVRAEKLFDYFVDLIRQRGIQVRTGVFQAMMDVNLINDGPVTFVLQSQEM